MAVMKFGVASVKSHMPRKSRTLLTFYSMRNLCIRLNMASSAIVKYALTAYFEPYR